MESRYEEIIKVIRRHSYILLGGLFLLLPDFSFFSSANRMESLARELLFTKDQKHLAELMTDWENCCWDFDEVALENYQEQDYPEGTKWAYCYDQLLKILEYKKKLYDHSIAYSSKEGSQRVPYFNIKVQNLIFPLLVKSAYALILVLLLISVLELERFQKKIPTLNRHKLELIQTYYQQIKIPPFNMLLNKILPFLLGGLILVFTIKFLFESLNLLFADTALISFQSDIKLVGLLNLIFYLVLILLSAVLIRKLKSFDLVSIK